MIGEETIEGYMPSIFIIKAKIENPTEWYVENLQMILNGKKMSF